MTPLRQRLVAREYGLPSYSTISSSFGTSSVRPSGGRSAATSSPWYRRVSCPPTVPDANPPIPLVTSHSRDSAEAKSPQISRPKLMRGLQILASGPSISAVVSFPPQHPKHRGFLRKAHLSPAWVSGQLPARKGRFPNLLASIFAGGMLAPQPWGAAPPFQDPAPLCWSSLATSPVQPVWWLAPMPAPLSPWKYSLNKIKSRQWGSVWNIFVPP